MEFADILIAILAIIGLWWLLGRWIRYASRRTASGSRPRLPRVRTREPRIKPTYEYEPVTDRLQRRVKGVQLPPEDRKAILNFLASHTGVEAYVEPKTVMHPLSVVLVDGEGEWKRFELADDAFVKDLAKSRGVPVFDAARTGYPPRMRRQRPAAPVDPEPVSEASVDPDSGEPDAAGRADDPSSS